jgi:hypothetical protein
MNNKHLACVFIGLIIFAQLYCVVMVKSKRDAMSTEAEAASLAAEGASQQVTIASTQLTGLKARTEAIRQYLSIWDPFLRKSESEERGQTLIDDLIRQGGVTQLSGKYDPAPNAGNTYIPKVVKAELLFEDDYHKTLEWLGEVERSLPAARISKCRLTKGTTSNDVKMEISLELPIVAQEGAAAPKA